MQPPTIQLVGNPRSKPTELIELRDELDGLTGPRTRHITVGRDLASVSNCDVVLTATSSVGAILDQVPFAPGTIICDVARPFDTSPAMRARDDITVIDGGLVDLPDPTFTFGQGNIQGLPVGVQLACLSETILLALAGERRDFGIGDAVTLEQVDRVMALAEEHGFRLHEPELDALDMQSVGQRSIC